jgi:hypothetical protein
VALVVTNVVPSSLISSTLMVEETRSPEAPVLTTATRRHIPEVVIVDCSFPALANVCIRYFSLFVLWNFYVECAAPYTHVPVKMLNIKTIQICHIM